MASRWPSDWPKWPTRRRSCSYRPATPRPTDDGSLPAPFVVLSPRMSFQGMRFLRSSRDALSREVPGRQLAAALAGLVLGLGAEWMARSKQSPLTAGVDLAVGWTLIACGLIAWTRRPKSRVGPLIAITGFAWFLGTFADSDVEALATVGVALATVYLGPLFHAIIGYPSGRLSGWLTLVVVAASYIYAATAQLARGNVVMVSVVPIVVALIVLGTTIRGYLVAAGADRQARMTAIVAAAAVSLPLAGGSVGRLVSAGPDAERVVLGGLEAALVLVAVVFLVDLVRAP